MVDRGEVLTQNPWNSPPARLVWWASIIVLILSYGGRGWYSSGLADMLWLHCDALTKEFEQGMDCFELPLLSGP